MMRILIILGLFWSYFGFILRLNWSYFGGGGDGDCGWGLGGG